MATLESSLKTDERFERRVEKWRGLLDEIRAEEGLLRQGGGPTRMERHRAKGKMTARERIEALADRGSEFLEIGLWAAHGMYEEYGGAPSAGVGDGDRFGPRS